MKTARSVRRRAGEKGLQPQYLVCGLSYCPGTHQSGGKRLSGRIRQGNRWAKTVLIQAAHAAGHTQSYLGEQYRRISARRGAKRAAVAVGHRILVIFASFGQDR